MAILETVAERIATATFEQATRTGDDALIDEVSRTLGETSPTLQEAFNTAIRYLQAEARAHALMAAKTGTSG